MDAWFIALVAVLSSAYGYYRGYRYGVKETEERWHEAVGRTAGRS